MRPALRGSAKLPGSPLASYRRRVWEPRIRNTGTIQVQFRCINNLGGITEFPPELSEQGLCQKVLSSAIEQVRAGDTGCS